MNKVLVIVGPTAIGKSSLGIDLAQTFNGEIISGDSIQVYRQLNIGSAKISNEEKRGVPHHLLNIKDIDDGYSVAEFQKEARRLIDQISEAKKLPIIVGGTGLYIKAVVYDYLFEDEMISANSYDELTNDELYQKLSSLDEMSAQSIHINNRKRLIRALMMAESGKSKTSVLAKQEHKLIYDCLIIGLTTEREQLYQQIDKRVDKMLDDGLINEIDDLRSRYEGLFAKQALQAIGYREWKDYYQGTMTKEETVAEIKKHSRQFAKRQYTWFNNQMHVDWYDINDKEYRSKITARIKWWLANG